MYKSFTSDKTRLVKCNRKLIHYASTTAAATRVLRRPTLLW